MFYLIDGYNLLFRVGLITARISPNGLEYSRRRLLALLHQAHGEQSHNVTVIFDAKHFPPGVSAEQSFHGIHVRFAVRYPQADDLLEDLIQQAEHPRVLALVSDDHRIQQAARRQGCVVMPCGEYMDWLGQANRERRQQTVKPEKPEVVPEDESELWQQTFAELENDPAMRELFEIPWSDPDKPIC